MAETVDATTVTPPGGGSRFRRWAARESIEDYSLRYAPTTFRKWAPIMVASTALGGIAYLADYAIGSSIVPANGAPNALVGILRLAAVIVVTGIPIAYYWAKYALDMDLLTRDAGFGYFGSTLTSLIYGSFTFIFFALEGSIMAQAFHLGLDIPSLIFVAPLIALAVQHPDAYSGSLSWSNFFSRVLHAHPAGSTPTARPPPQNPRGNILQIPTTGRRRTNLIISRRPARLNDSPGTLPNRSP